MISLVGPISLLFVSLFFFGYFAWSISIDRKLKKAQDSTSTSCTLTSGQINSKYVGDIFGLIISFFMIILTGWLSFSTSKENGILTKVSNKISRLRGRNTDV
jgi:Na+-transporting methylmalonyl-CoA/oxaloacetate decarboxylase beta subunit